MQPQAGEHQQPRGSGGGEEQILPQRFQSDYSLPSTLILARTADGRLLAFRTIRESLCGCCFFWRVSFSFCLLFFFNNQRLFYLLYIIVIARKIFRVDCPGFESQLCHLLGFLGGSDSKESACNAGDLGSMPGSGRSPGEGNAYRFKYSCLENSVNREAWQAIVHAVSNSQT